ncbi:unnamed protein product [Mytilus edulis]|uniref:Uncharacterized protein n=1 Tax=Mytilus edulis TaxID=6550 RepID=A0A8S3UZW8_MYTED|nr:unnamed protein product [Mytilus edulis]
MGDSNRDGTNYESYPMDFTCVNQYNDQQIAPTYYGNTQPGIFSPSGQQRMYCPGSDVYSYPEPVSVPTLTASEPLTPSGAFNPRESYLYPSMTSTPIPEHCVAENSNNKKSFRNNRNSVIKWRGFFVKWIISIAIVTSVIGGILTMNPFHDVVCWLRENYIVIPTTVFILFMCTVIFKMFEEYQSLQASIGDQEGRPLNDTNDCIYPMTTPKVRRKLTFQPEIPNETILSTGDDKNRSSYRPETQANRTFSGTGKDIWADFLRYFENVAILNGRNNDRKRLIFNDNTKRPSRDIYAWTF